MEFLTNDFLKFVLSGLLIFFLLYSLLKKFSILGESDIVNTSVAVLATLLLSFSGIMSFVIASSLNIFFLLFFVFFLIMVLLLFLGFKFEDITSIFKGKISKNILIGILILFFLVIIAGSFFNINNYFQTSQEIPDEINNVPNTESEKIDLDIEVENDISNSFLDRDTVLVFIFLVVLVIASFFIS